MKTTKERISYIFIAIGLILWFVGSYSWDAFAVGLPVGNVSLNDMAKAPNGYLSFIGMLGLGFAPFMFMLALFYDDTEGKSMLPTIMVVIIVGSILVEHVMRTGNWVNPLIVAFFASSVFYRELTSSSVKN